MVFYKGMVSTRKGVKLNLETKDKISKAKKGTKAWNKGLPAPWAKVAHKGKVLSEETRNKISLATKGRETYERTLKYKRLMSQRLKGVNADERSGNWKGDKVGMTALHMWIGKKLGKPDTCAFCGKTGLKGIQIQWANKDHTYKRNLEDWIRLCSKCHMEYDLKNGFRRMNRKRVFK